MSIDPVDRERTAPPCGTDLAETQLGPGPRRLSTIDYQRHRPERTLLHEIVREQLEGFIAGSRERAAPVARCVERELRAYLECGVLAHGFLRLHCDACGRDRLLAFSCKGRAKAGRFVLRAAEDAWPTPPLISWTA